MCFCLKNKKYQLNSLRAVKKIGNETFGVRTC